MHVTDRVVVVAAGFGVWRDNRHVASGLWADVVEVVAFGSGQAPPEQLRISLTLRDGSVVSIDEDLAGYQSFLDAAESKLPGMTPRAVSSSGDTPTRDARHAGTVLFTRRMRD